MVGLLICITHIGEEMLKTLLFIIRDPHLTLLCLTLKSTLSDAFAFEVHLTLSLFAFVIIHQINLCLAAFTDPPLEN